MKKLLISIIVFSTWLISYSYLLRIASFESIAIVFFAQCQVAYALYRYEKPNK